PLHRAGLVGLDASCRTDTVQRWLQSHEVVARREGNRLILDGLPCEVEAVHDLLTCLYEIDEDGLIRFPLITKLQPWERAKVQNILMTSFLQHPKSRKADSKPVTRPMSEDNQEEYSFKPLQDFHHRSLGIAEDIVDARKRGRMIELAGWAMPGAMVKHNAHGSATAVQDTPERYLLLMLAPLGCMWYTARAYMSNGDWDPRVEIVVVVPRATDLAEASDRLYQYYTSHQLQVRRLDFVAGVADAVMHTAVAFAMSSYQSYRVSQDLYAMCFGTVPWSKQQKTRTRVLTVAKPSRSTTAVYRNILKELTNLSYRREDGTTFSVVMPMRERIAENVLSGRSWYLGFSEYVVGERGALLRRWRKGLMNLVADRRLWDDEAKHMFVELIQQAVSNRYGQVNSRVEQVGADRGRAFEREYQRMVLDFAHCRSQEMFRQTLVRFIAQTHPRLKRDTDAVGYLERDLLLRFAIQEQDWREVRDLCLLAIATYRRREDESDRIESGQVGDGMGLSG
ncbi:MAG: type I-MYXAN CRISPR-associated Cas8a1/Cmx1, partial [Alicyclobacillus sp.]|nr:type I-MYXAN CRISPR-associated Cas8a1/Cmx1 [Alicyclobacillus sp.]